MLKLNMAACKQLQLTGEDMLLKEQNNTTATQLLIR